MSIEFESAKRLDALKQGIEAKTGETYADLTGGVNALIAGYGQGGGDEGFVGIKFSNFSYRGNPQTADARSLPGIEEQRIFGGFPNLFANGNGNGNGGFFSMLEEVYLPQLYTIQTGMFTYCSLLKTLRGDLTTVIQIGVNAFLGCKNLTEFPYMPNLTTIQNDAFSGCIGLTEVKLYSTLTTMQGRAFNGCTNITDIYVPWAEGAVANAPWGATNATIHYNTTYDADGNPIV